MRIGRLIAGDAVLIPRVLMATGMFDRMRGLLGRDRLPEGEGMLLSPCHAVHTWFMRFPIDAVFLDGEWTVLLVCRGVRPFRMVGAGWRARHTLEVQSGWLPQNALVPGMRVEVVE
jgi:uncharacterized membrane protein (UPF0127 family)